MGKNFWVFSPLAIPFGACNDISRFGKNLMVYDVGGRPERPFLLLTYDSFGAASSSVKTAQRNSPYINKGGVFSGNVGGVGLNKLTEEILL